MASSISQAYTVAHTARCKLNMAANRPDRNLRFILGHAYTVDNVLLQIAQIEGMGGAANHSSNQDHNHSNSEPPLQPNGRRVSFHENAAKPTGELQSGLAPPAASKASKRAKSPPPPQAQESDSDEEGYGHDVDGVENKDGDLGLVRFESAALQPPRTISDDESDSDDEDDVNEPVSPEWEPSQDELRTVVASDGDEEMADLYESVRRCCCKDAPQIDRMWALPQDKVGRGGNGLTAVVKVQA